MPDRVDRIQIFEYSFPNCWRAFVAIVAFSAFAGFFVWALVTERCYQIQNVTSRYEAKKNKTRT